MVKAALVCLLVAAPLYAQEMPPDYDAALKTLGRQGDFKDGVLKVNIPRNDLKVSVAGVATPTPFGFGGWWRSRAPSITWMSSWATSC
jgi:hypothetical protein